MHSLLNLAAQHRNEIILAAAAVTTAIAARVVMRLLFKQGGAGAGGFEGFTDSSTESESSSSSESVFDAVDSFSAENEVQKEQREKQLAEKENLSPLFEMQEVKTKAKARIDSEKEQAKKTTGLKHKDKTPPREIQAQLDYLIGEINSLTAKGLSDTQAAQNLLGRVQSASLDELAPLIDAMLLFVRTQSEAGRNAAVVGMDERFEQKAALSALARGNPEQAVAFLQNCAEKTLQEIKITRNEHEKNEKFSLAGDYFRAAAAVQRPFDLEKSWQSLCRSKECDSENVITEMMMGRACYEDGQTQKARGIFEKLARSDAQKPDFVQDYAEKMIPRITTERTMLHAHRIKENYQSKDAEAGQHLKTAQQRRVIMDFYEDEHDNVRV